MLSRHAGHVAHGRALVLSSLVCGASTLEVSASATIHTTSVSSVLKDPDTFEAFGATYSCIGPSITMDQVQSRRGKKLSVPSCSNLRRLWPSSHKGSGSVFHCFSTCMAPVRCTGTFRRSSQRQLTLSGCNYGKSQRLIQNSTKQLAPHVRRLSRECMGGIPTTVGL